MVCIRADSGQRSSHRLAAVHSREWEHTHPGFETTALDTTGAGDAFAAGYLAARRGVVSESVQTAAAATAGDRSLPGRTAGDGVNVATALAVANACGAVAAGEVGARVAISWDRIRAVLDGGGSGGAGGT